MGRSSLDKRNLSLLQPPRFCNVAGKSGGSMSAPVWSSGYKPTKEDLKGLYNHRFETAGGLVLDCYLAFEEEERATYDHPGSAAAVELIWALVEGVDISEVIGDLAGTIEEEALGDMEAKAEDDQYDRGQERYEDRNAE
jgi:hypothetical protein